MLILHSTMLIGTINYQIAGIIIHLIKVNITYPFLKAQIFLVNIVAPLQIVSILSIAALGQLRFSELEWHIEEDIQIGLGYAEMNKFEL